MIKKSMAISALTLSALCASQANAIVFTGSAIGSWSDVTATSSDITRINNNDEGGVAKFNWGTPADSNTTKNSFKFDGAGSDDGDAEWSTELDSAFRIGSFRYTNGSTYNSAGVTGVSLNVALTITSPVLSDSAYNFDFSIDNTPNTTGNDVLDGDIVTSTSGLSSSFFESNGVMYTLELLGFSSDAGQTIHSDFSSPENQKARAGLYAKITEVSVSEVPLPPSLLFLGAGLMGLGALRKKATSKA